VSAGRVGPELPLQDADLVTQHDDLGVLLTITHRQQPQHREGIGNGQISQTQQLERGHHAVT
jgi:hypothetical protein